MLQAFVGKQKHESKASKTLEKSLPRFLLREIDSFLPISDLKEYITTCRTIHNAARRDVWDRRVALWQRRFTVYFPHLAQDVFHAQKEMVDERKNDARKKARDYRWEFAAAVKSEYENLDLRQVRLMNLFKKGDLKEIKKEKLGLGDFLHLYDSNGRGLAYWANHGSHQHLLDYCYKFFRMTRYSAIMFLKNEFINDFPAPSESDLFLTFLAVFMVGNLLVMKSLSHELKVFFGVAISAAIRLGNLENVNYLLNYAIDNKIFTFTKEELLSHLSKRAIVHNKPNIVRFLCDWSGRHLEDNKGFILDIFRFSIISDKIAMVRFLCQFVCNDGNLKDKDKDKLREIFIDAVTYAIYADKHIAKCLIISWTNLFNDPGLHKHPSVLIFTNRWSVLFLEIKEEVNKILQEEIKPGPKGVLYPLVSYFENWNSGHKIIFWRKEPEYQRYCLAKQLIDAWQAGPIRLAKVIQCLLHDIHTESSFGPNSFREALIQIQERLAGQPMLDIISHTNSPAKMRPEPAA